MISEMSAQSGPPPEKGDSWVWHSSLAILGHELFDKNDPTNNLLKPTLPSDFIAQGPLATMEQIMFLCWVKFICFLSSSDKISGKLTWSFWKLPISLLLAPGFLLEADDFLQIVTIEGQDSTSF